MAFTIFLFIYDILFGYTCYTYSLEGTIPTACKPIVSCLRGKRREGSSSTLPPLALLLHQPSRRRAVRVPEHCLQLVVT